ncbi:MAG TPA: AbrB/MazE/SpoVT family DNA-binding domain-containing protein [Virgibacillus sp.]|mgnify:CR=1 FL=1|nr:AbrB/MazE/SpoVT family DNA-binding domain-containing protein [Virgibacillus sp.]HLR67030.1 AbrB/MazE/SpoVT family DNA-binding domain-containing protein [Virgibacillus sp.]
MVPTGITVELSKRILFRIPSTWRSKMNIEPGNIAKICIKNNSIMIKACNQYTTEITSTIGREGQIYIPTEVRDHFNLKGIKRFKVFIDEVNSNIILIPFE